MQEFHPAELYLHQEYDLNTVDNDIALIRLKETVKFNEHVRPICLPKTNNTLPVGTRCTVIGWGKQGDAGILHKCLQTTKYQRQMLTD